MVDIALTEREKTIISKATTLLRLRFGKKASFENIHKELINHPHPLIRKIVETTNQAGEHIKNEIKSGGTWWQRDNMNRLTELFLWCLIHHKKYRKLLDKFASSIFADEYGKLSFNDKPFTFVDNKLISYLMKFAYKKMKEQWTYDLILGEMETGSNTAVRLILNKVATALENIDDKVERVMLYDFAATGLWMVQHDTAYRDMFFWIMDNVGNDEIRKAVKPFYVPPEKWYINIWHDHKLESMKKRKNGELSIFGHDIVESMSVPEMRNKQLDDIIKRGK